MHALLFDIDGTLLRSGGAGQSAMEAALTAEFHKEADASAVPTAGRTDRAIVEEFFAVYGVPYESEAVQRFRDRYLDLLPEHLSACEGVVLPGVPMLLDRLAERDDVSLGLLTGNFERGAQAKLIHYDLHHHFDYGGYGDDHADRNDVARMALTNAIVHIGREPSRVWVIGDTPNDVRCGRAIDAVTIAVATGYYPKGDLEAAEPDHLFDDLSDVEQFLSLLR